MTSYTVGNVRQGG